MSPQSSSGERTEPATAKRRRDARERGQVLKSTEISTAVSLLVMFGFLNIVINGFTDKICSFFSRYLASPSAADPSLVFTETGLTVLFSDVLVDFIMLMAPLFLVAMLAGFAVNLAQVGFLFTSKPLMPMFSRINPIEGFKRIFSSRSVAELIKAIIKVAVLVWLIYGDYTDYLDEFPVLISTSSAAALTGILKTAIGLGLKMGLALMIIAVIDYLYQWWRHEKDLRMTKQEVKEEYKQLEGSPEIRGRIRQKQRQISAMRMMQSMPTADVVVTNPTHFAVALRYAEKIDKAPVVIAKGADFLAAKIKEAAKENKVEIVENKELARSLYFYCEVGDTISEDLYQAVADILVYVYGIKNKSRST